jgi:hypothetical protein
VFAVTKDRFYNDLDLHADTVEGDVKLPLVVYGDEGSGKSALLANWVMKRKAIKHKDEFLFQYFVDSSSKSTQLAHLLSKLETELKGFFQLREMEVPDSEERLRWSLNRFLGAAVKKKGPESRIVIVIDGVNKLKGEDCRDGELYWLPTDLPPCVRFIVSTVEHDRATRFDEDVVDHRTFIELNRRQCPILKMEPLGIPTRHAIIDSYCGLFPGYVDLQENQQFRIVTSAASAHPLYLRCLLQSLRLGLIMTTHSKDHLLDTFLRCSTAFELTEKVLNLCMFSITNEDYVDLMGKVLTVVYVSRNGLSEEEVWGIVKLVSKVEVDEMHKQKLMAILKNFTMCINNLHSFSHEVYKEVVYSKFICNNDTFIRWHILMARYFGHLPTCDRKLTCLPFHLEVAGSWNKVKNCLTDVEMFNLWWTPKFKKDFIKYWSALTAAKLPSDGNGDEMKEVDSRAAKKPTYDVVEEYVKSVEEYRHQRIPPQEETVADVIMRIGEFLIEFAVQGHELNADVPPNVHPQIPAEDLASLGVPFIEYDEEGRSVLVVPTMVVNDEDGAKTQGEAPVSANEDLPECTTYFFARWMWIQFPLMALGNCGQRYNDGIAVRDANKPWERESRKKVGAGGTSFSQDDNQSTSSRKRGVDNPPPQRQFSMSINSMKLPQIKFVKKVARSVRKVPDPDALLAHGPDSNGAPDGVQMKIMGLQDANRDLREELDFLVQQKVGLSKRLEEVKMLTRDLQCSADSTTLYDKDLHMARERDVDGASKLEQAMFVHTNLKSLLIMCQRHPAHSPAIIFEVEKKLEQDAYLIHEIGIRLWEQKFEMQVHQTAFRKMKNLVKGGVRMHSELLDYRYDKKRDLTNEETRNLTLAATSREKMRTRQQRTRQKKRNQDNEISGERDVEGAYKAWHEKWSIISGRTGITDPDVFFERLNYGGHLEDQIDNVRKYSETRRETLKNDGAALEIELEEVRSEASMLGGHPREVYEQHKKLSESQQNLRRVKERTEGTELLQQQVIAGLNHINEILGVNLSEREGNVADIIRDIESVLETLVEENEKQQQGTGGVDSPTSFTRPPGTREGGPMNLEGHVRPSELENALTKYQEPKARLAAILPSRPVDDVMVSSRDIADMEDDAEDEGTWSRRFVKHQSFKTMRIQSKKKPNSAEAFAATN